MSSFDAAARRLHPDSYKQEATSAAPVVEKKKKQKKRKAEALPSVGDVVAARGRVAHQLVGACVQTSRAIRRRGLS